MEVGGGAAKEGRLPGGGATRATTASGDGAAGGRWDGDEDGGSPSPSNSGFASVVSCLFDDAPAAVTAAADPAAGRRADEFGGSSAAGSAADGGAGGGSVATCGGAGDASAADGSAAANSASGGSVVGSEAAVASASGGGTAPACSGAAVGCGAIGPVSASERRSRVAVRSLLDAPSLLPALRSAGMHEVHAWRLWRALAKRGARRAGDVAGLPKAMYGLLEREFSAAALALAETVTSADGSTVKLLLSTADGHRVEAVLMRYGQVELAGAKRNPARNQRCAPRATLCVSSQVGCSMNCRFCATGSMGLRASLTCGEILEQLLLANRVEPGGVRNVVFMGMGEPLDNYAEVVAAARLMTDVRVFGLAPHRVTVSSVGVVPRLRQMLRDLPDVSLAISLHAPTQEIREKIVPSAKQWHIDDIMAAAAAFVRGQRLRSQRNRKYQSLLVEYVLLKDVNCRPADAEALARFLQPFLDVVAVNLIPYNPTLQPEGGLEMRPPLQSDIDAVVAALRAGGVTTTVRQTFGQDINSACGQLVVEAEGEGRKIRPAAGGPGGKNGGKRGVKNEAKNWVKSGDGAADSDSKGTGAGGEGEGVSGDSGGGFGGWICRLFARPPRLRPAAPAVAAAVAAAAAAAAAAVLLARRARRTPLAAS